MSLFTKAALVAINGRTAFTGGAAYFAGGFASSASQSNGQKYAFSDDTRSAMATGLSAVGRGLGGFAYPQVAGYITGPDSGSKIDKFKLADDTRSTISVGIVDGLSDAGNMVNHAMGQNDAVAGYMWGGLSGGIAYSQIRKLMVPNDTMSLITGLGSQSNSCGVSWSGYGAWFLGGNLSGGFGAQIYRLNFVTDTPSGFVDGFVLPAARQWGAGVSNNGVAGYVAGGETSGPTAVSSIVKLTFSNEAVSTISATLQSTRGRCTGASNPATAGYIAGGSTNSTHVDKLALPAETCSNLTALASGRQEMGGFGSL